MIEVLRTDATGVKKNWLERYWVYASVAVAVAVFLSVFATLSSKNGAEGVEVFSTLMDMQEQEMVSSKEKKQASRFLLKHRDLMREMGRFFLDDAVIVEQLTKKASSQFSQVTRLISLKRFKEALDLSLKQHEDLQTPTLKCLNLLRILALESTLKNVSHQKTWAALEELKVAHPMEVGEVLDFYKIGDISVDALYS
jgi:hypothetical protein